MMFRLTPVVKFIIVTAVALYIYTYVAHRIGSPFADILALKTYDSKGFMPFQIFTYMFSHANESFFHILFNMLIFAIFGPQLEDFLGAKRFGNFLMICGVGVGAAWLIWHAIVGTPPGYIYSIRGFSGVVFGVFALMALYFPEKEIRLLFPPIPIKLKYLSIIYIAYEFISFNNHSDDKISHISHLFGVFFAMIMFKVWEIMDNR